MIRYNSSDNKNIERVVSNFNRKIARLQKAGYDILPSRVSARTIKSQFTNRRDLNVYLRNLQRFGKRGAENIVTIGGKNYTQYDIDIFRRSLRLEKSRLEREISEAQTLVSATPKQHDIYTANLQSRREALSSKWTEIITSKLGEKLLDQPRRYTETYDNYFEIMFQDAYQAGFEDEKIEYIKEKLLSLSPRQFIRALEDDPNIQYIFDYYHSLTRTSYMGGNEGYEGYQKLYENIDAIVEKYKK